MRTPVIAIGLAHSLPGDLGNVDQGKRLHARFARAGTYAYVCSTTRA
jgi:hypothetical protein